MSTTAAIATGLVASSFSRRGRTEAPPAPHRLFVPLLAADSATVPTLRALAAQVGITVGTVAEPGLTYQGSTGPQLSPYDEVLTREFGLIVIPHLFWGTAGGPNILRPDQSSFNPEPLRVADNMLTVAARFGFRVRGNHLVWGTQRRNPGWLTSGSFSRSEAIAILQDHIRRLMPMFTGRIAEWTAVNEPYGSQDVWQRLIGTDYVDIAFETARAADPAALLIYNDYGNHAANPRSNSNYTDVKRLKAKGLVDAFGVQMHLDGAHPPQKQAVIDNLNRFKDLGVLVQVTELDVIVQNLPGSTADRFSAQAKIYRDMFEALLAASGQSFTIWGIGDKYSWLERPAFFPPTGSGAPDANPTPFDDDMKPKPAYFAMLDVLKSAAAHR